MEILMFPDGSDWLSMDLKDRSILIVSFVLILLIAVLAVMIPALSLHRAQDLLESPSPGVAEPSPVQVQTESPLLSPVSTTVPETPVIQGPPAFRLLVTPVEARVRPGDTIVYSLTVEPEGGFDEPISLRLDVRALFLYQESFDLGTIGPPFPKTVDYRFVVPSDVPAGITVSGVLTGDGGDYQDSVSLILIISG
jgi:hypothetical protein